MTDKLYTQAQLAKSLVAEWRSRFLGITMGVDSEEALRRVGNRRR
jgi:hypothetical protein